MEGDIDEAAGIDNGPAVLVSPSSTRRFASGDESRNVWWLSWLSFGESWHNNHHAFPSSAFHGLRSWEIDPGGWVIRALERSGLAWRVVRIDTTRQRRKLLHAQAR